MFGPSRLNDAPSPPRRGGEGRGEVGKVRRRYSRGRTIVAFPPMGQSLIEQARQLRVSPHLTLSLSAPNRVRRGDVGPATVLRSDV
jgi:hypothetical protein